MPLHSLTVVPREFLLRLAATVPQPEPQAHHYGQRQNGRADFDLDALLSRLGADLGSPTPYNGGRKWVLARCPWNPDHTDRAAFVIQFPSGGIAAGCHHNGCQGKKWHDLRDILDPGWHDRHAGGATFSPTGHGANGHGGATSHAPSPSDGEDHPRNLTDAGNGKRLVARHGRDLLYCDLWSAWQIWDGQRFGRDVTGEIDRRAKETALHIHEQAQGIDGDDARRALIKWALRSEAGAARREMIKAASSEPGIAVTPSAFDGNPWLLNVANGTLDLRTGALRLAERADRLTKLAPVVYDPAAECPIWLAFLDRIMDGKQEVIDFLQRAVGYSLTGDTGEHCLFLLFGTGRNGKSTFVETLGAMVGDYAMTTSTDTLLVQRNSGIPNDLARLVGARLVSASESEDGKRLAESLVKQLTGGDTISARFLRAEFFDFRPAFKLWFRTNHKPTIKGTDDGIWARIRLVPFTQRIPDSEIDKRLPERLLAELPGILAWAVQGCLAWRRDGLGMPTEVAKATAQYRNEMDVLGGFLADGCVVGLEQRCTAKDLYAAYTKWAEEGGERPLTQKALGMRLIERGFVNAKGTGGTRMWAGLRVAGGG